MPKHVGLYYTLQYFSEDEIRPIALYLITYLTSVFFGHNMEYAYLIAFMVLKIDNSVVIVTAASAFFSSQTCSYSNLHRS